MIAFLLTAGRFLLGNWKWIAVAGAIALLGLDDGRLRLKVAGLETTVAQKDTAIAGMESQQAKNIAAAEKKKTDYYEAQIAKNNTVIKGLNADKAALQEKANAAELALSQIPVAPTPEGCPDPMSLPVVGAFTRGLPSDP